MNKLITLILLFFSFYSISAQKILIVKSDTIVAIKPEHLKIINKTFEERDWLKLETAVLESKIKNDSLIINNLTSKNNIQKNIISDQEKSIILQKENFKNQWSKEKSKLIKNKRKSYLYGGLGGTLLGLLIGIFIAK